MNFDDFSDHKAFPGTEAGPFEIIVSACEKMEADPGSSSTTRKTLMPTWTANIVITPSTLSSPDSGDEINFNVAGGVSVGSVVAVAYGVNFADG